MTPFPEMAEQSAQDLAHAIWVELKEHRASCDSIHQCKKIRALLDPAYQKLVEHNADVWRELESVLKEHDDRKKELNRTKRQLSTLQSEHEIIAQKLARLEVASQKTQAREIAPDQIADQKNKDYPTDGLGTSDDT